MTILLPPKDSSIVTHRNINGLDLVYIYNETDISNVVLAVDVGYNSDPDKYPGVAHLLEHSIFLGSKKYPEKDLLNTFPYNHGGNGNASTSPDKTKFYVNCEKNSFEKLLDIFLSAFIEPLLYQDDVMAEILAVDSEHIGLLKSSKVSNAVKIFSNKNHPFSRFNVGNLASLSVPEIANVVADFYKKYYTTDRMKLIIQHSTPFETVESRLIEMVKLLPVAAKPLGVLNKNPPVLIEKRQIACLDIPGIKTITFIWEVPFIFSEKFNQYDILMEYVLDNCLHNVLEKKLKKLELIESLNLSIEEITVNQKIVDMEIVLNVSNNPKLCDIYYAVKEYLSQIHKQDIPKWIFDELKLLSKIRWYDEKIDLLDVSQNLFIYPIEYMFKSYTMTEYNKKDANEFKEIFFKRLNLEKCLIFHNLDSDKKKLKKNKLYDIKYIVENTLPQAEKITKTYYDEIYYKPNKYIPKLSYDEHNIIPKPVYENENSIFYFKPFDLIQSKNLIIKMYIYYSDIIDIKGVLYNNILSSYTIDLFAEEDTKIELGGAFTNYSFSNICFGSVYIECFKENYLEIIKSMQQIFIIENNSQNKKNYQIAKTKIMKYFIESKNDDEKIIRKNELTKFLYDLDLSTGIKKIFEKLSFEDFIDHVSKKIYCNSQKRGLIIGDVNNKKASEISEFISTEWFKCSGVKGKFKNVDSIIDRPPGTTYANQKISTNDKSNYMTMVFTTKLLNFKKKGTLAASVKSYMLISILNRYLQQRYYNSLRTDQQLGYNVHSFTGNTKSFSQSMFYISFTVRTDRYNPSYLEKKTLEFIKNEYERVPFGDNFDFFKNIKKVIYKDVESNWMNIYYTIYNPSVKNPEKVFNQSTQLSSLFSITFSDFISFFYNTLINKDTKRLLSIKIDSAE